MFLTPGLEDNTESRYLWVMLLIFLPAIIEVLAMLKKAIKYIETVY